MIKKISYILNSIRLFVFKTKGEYAGSLLQRIPVNVSVAVSHKGKISLSNGILFRGPGYISVSGGKLVIEKDVFVNTSSYIVCREKISIGEGTVIGPNVCIVDHDHNYQSDNMRNTFKCDEIIIGKNVWIGANAVILRGTYIGDNCVVGAGTVVKGKYTANTLIFNNREICVKTIKR